MRVVALVNNWVGVRVLEAIVDGGDDLAGVVVHAKDTQRCGKAIHAAVQKCGADVFEFEKARIVEQATHYGMIEETAVSGQEEYFCLFAG